MAANNNTTAPGTVAEETQEDSLDCDACKLDGTKVNATHFCEQCDDYMCDSCEAHHKKVKATRNHKLRKSLPRKESKNIVTAAEELMLPDLKSKTGKSYVDASITVNKTADIKFYYDRSKPFKYHTDQLEPDVTGILPLSSGELLIVDGQNHRLKLLDDGMNIKEILPISGFQYGYPYDVDLLSENEVIVTLPADKVLQFFTIFPQLQFSRTVPLNNQGYGVTVTKTNIFVACHEGDGRPEVIVLDRDGRRQKVIDLEKIADNFSRPNYIAVNEQNGNLFVTGGSEVLCLSAEGNIIYRREYKAPAKANGLVVDDGGNALVCYQEVSEIITLKSDGTLMNTRLSAEQGIKYPKAMAYRPRDELLFIGGCNQNELTVFKLT